MKLWLLAVGATVLGLFGVTAVLYLLAVLLFRHGDLLLQLLIAGALLGMFAFVVLAIHDALENRSDGKGRSR